ncbi:MAG TPA: outer membrane protein transport protein [Kofleriaceae bacterium]|nr:outer membrane protein transport protein [Kofleriaceae bacterium]
MRTISIVTAGLALLGLGEVASANAFLFEFYDAKAVGRGNASAATDSDPSAISYNIGGLAIGRGTTVTVGGSLLMPSASYTDPSGATTHSEASHPVVPHLFASSRMNDLVAIGIGFHAPFGLALSWPDSAPTSDQVKDESVRTFFITPAIGVDLGKLVPGLTLGAGLDLVPATLEMTQLLFFGETRGQARLGGSAFGIGGRLGATYTPEALPQLSVGAMWRSRVTEDVTGKADFDVADPYRSQLPPDGDISTTFVLPQSVSVGAAYRPSPALELEADAQWVNWSTLKELRIHMPGGADAASPLAGKNTVTFNVGAEYQLARYHAAVRVGYIYDPTALPATTLGVLLPDISHHELTGGASYRLGEYDLHLGVLYMLPATRATAEMPYMPVHKGSYEVQALVTSLTLDGHFGR